MSAHPRSSATIKTTFGVRAAVDSKVAPGPSSEVATATVPGCEMIAANTIVADRNELYGLNLVGLRRRKVPRDSIQALRTCYKDVLVESINVKARASEMLQGEYRDIEEARHFLEFFQSGKRGFARATRN